jgi:DNA invertase Pin-like site-specific DNA recombinase
VPAQRVAKTGEVVAYLRVSTDEQGESGAGLAAQADAIAREVDRRGWTLLESYTDVASGKSRAMRPGLERALGDVHAGRAGTLMVAKLDRLSRSLIDFATITADAQKRGWNLVALDLGVDLSTPAGEFLASVMASAAQWERRIIGQRTADALRARRAEGVTLGRPRTVPPDVRERILTARGAGLSYYAIAKELNADGVPTGQGGVRWYGSSVRAVFVGEPVT